MAEKMTQEKYIDESSATQQARSVGNVIGWYTEPKWFPSPCGVSKKTTL